MNSVGGDELEFEKVLYLDNAKLGVGLRDSAIYM
jgi:hypothetical protein